MTWRRPPGGLTALALGVLLATVPALVAAPPATAAPGAEVQGGDRLEVLSQSGFVPSDGVYEAILSWSGPIVDLNLEVRLYQLVGEEQELEERSPSGPLNQLPAVPLTSLPRDAAGNFVLRIPVRSVPLPAGDPARVYLPDPGVYPLQLEITSSGGDTLASRFTDLIRLPVELTGDPVPVAVVLTIGGGGLSLAEGVELLERFRGVDVSVLIDPSAVSGPDADPALVARLRAAIGDRHTVAVDPVALDVSALAEIGHLDLYDTVRRSGGDQVAAQLGRDVSTDLIPVERVPTAGAAAHLAGEVNVLLGPVGGEEGVLHTSRGELPMVSPDEDVMEVLSRRGSDPHDVLARFALRYREGRTRPVLIATGPGSGVTAEDVSVILQGLSQPGVIEATTVVEVAERASGELEPSERPAQDLRPTADLLQAAVGDLAHYTEFHVSGPLPPQYLEDRIVAALASDVTPTQRTDRLAAVRRDIDDAFGVISLPEGRTVNLAATTSPMPLTITSNAPGVRRVRITFTSDKLTFPVDGGNGGDSRVVEIPPGTSSLEFVVESRSLGVSPLDVIVSTPDGGQELTRTRITIRSTAIPGLGLLLSGAALVFLIAWWVLHVTRRRRTVPGLVGAEQVA